MHTITLMLVGMLTLLSTAVCERKDSISNTVVQKNKASGYQKLVRNLTTDYNKNIFPVCQVGDVMNVTIHIDMYQVITVDEKNQLITLNIWFKLYWFDCYMKWNPDDFHGVEYIDIAAENLWSPDITYFQKVNEDAQSGLNSAQASIVRVNSDGTALLSAQVVLKSFCKIDVAQFPFDDQYCHLTFTSWLHDISTIYLRSKTTRFGGTASYVSNEQWRLSDFLVTNRMAKYNASEYEFSEVTYSLHLHRKPLFYKFNLVFPCIMLSFIGILVFILPAESGEKVSLSITVLLSLTVFLLMVSENMPATSESVPFLAQYFGITIVLVSMSCAVTVLIINIHSKDDEGTVMPAIIKTIFIKGLGKLVCFSHEKHGHGHGKSNLDENLPFNNDIAVIDPQMAIRSMQEHHHGDWHQLSVILDRLFLVIFGTVTLVLTVVVLFKELNLGGTAHVVDHIHK